MALCSPTPPLPYLESVSNTPSCTRLCNASYFAEETNTLIYNDTDYVLSYFCVVPISADCYAGIGFDDVAYLSLQCPLVPVLLPAGTNIVYPCSVELITYRQSATAADTSLVVVPAEQHQQYGLVGGTRAYVLRPNSVSTRSSLQATV